MHKTNTRCAELIFCNTVISWLRCLLQLQHTQRLVWKTNYHFSFDWLSDWVLQASNMRFASSIPFFNTQKWTPNSTQKDLCSGTRWLNQQANGQAKLSSWQEQQRRRKNNFQQISFSWKMPTVLLSIILALGAWHKSHLVVLGKGDHLIAPSQGRQHASFFRQQFVFLKHSKQKLEQGVLGDLAP